MKKFKKKELEKETIELKKEIAMYHKEHEKQEKFQSEIHKEKEDYKEIFEILSAKYKTLKLRNDDLKAELKSNIENSNKRIFEIEKLKREVNNLKCEREILHNNVNKILCDNANNESFVDKILKDNKLYYIILSTLVIVNIFLIKVM